jgi:hypothetical protein
VGREEVQGVVNVQAWERSWWDVRRGEGAKVYIRVASLDAREEKRRTGNLPQRNAVNGSSVETVVLSVVKWVGGFVVNVLGVELPCSVHNRLDTWSFSKGQFDVLSTNARHKQRRLFYPKLKSLLPRTNFEIATFGFM